MLTKRLVGGPSCLRRPDLLGGGARGGGGGVGRGAWHVGCGTCIGLFYKGPRDVFSSTGVPPTDKRQPPTANRLPKIVSTQKRAWRFVDCIAPSMERRLPQHSSRHDGRVGAQIPDDFATDSTRWIRRRSPPPTGTAPATVLHLSEETASPYRRLQLLIAAGKAPLPSQEREVEGGKDSPATVPRHPDKDLALRYLHDE
ncbi:hypothetical protein B2J93_9443 [Marssonina coronariae]|uniref:Uncharacterized protein n=1 Tax=Diplocarpon coronariae TaxID=2795749 RepID=A0A218YX69_9HELO|nr:hypothetical protein B2J93_9443 [Marssonina coronariae]